MHPTSNKHKPPPGSNGNGSPPEARPKGGNSPSPAEVEAWLVEHLSELLRIDPDEIDIRTSFAQFGLSSREAAGLSADLELWLHRRISPAVFYDFPNIQSLARHLSGISQAGEEASVAAVKDGAFDEPVAVIGMACRFPGADDTEAFWELLRDGREAVVEVPAERWDVHAFYDPSLDKPGKMNTSRGGFLKHVDLFDPGFFGISEREAVRIDPQQRLLMEVAWEALENACLAPETLAGSATGTFVGISSSDYSLFQLKEPHLVDAYTATGNAHSIAANRLSYVLDLRGPSLAVDTACSSSLVAVHLACRSLLNGESSLALAGGVNLILAPQWTVTFSQAGMMSAQGRCQTFDADADGYVRGEGCGVLVLKRLSHALRDGDRILALVRGSAVNQDGRSNGLTAPNGPAQTAVIRAALDHAGLRPSEISYVETHGTGTPLGDPIEFQALSAALGERREASEHCFIGSVKTNIGHLEAAAGIAGLIKVILALRFREIPPHLHLTKLNPLICLDNTPFRIPLKCEPWQAGGSRLAGVSSFGFGGTNAHVVVEEAPALSTAPPKVDRPLHLLTLSTVRGESLPEMALRYSRFLSSHPEISLSDLCFTANTGRTHFSHRLTALAGSTGQLSRQLAAFAGGGEAQGLSAGVSRREGQFRPVFLFSGQGCQYEGMGRQLFETQPVFRRHLENCDELLRPHLRRSILPVIFSGSGSPSLLQETLYAQPALFALQYALAELWQSWGIIPGALLGHSVGEYVAACVAGVFTLEEGLRLVVERARLMQSLPPGGMMASVFADAEFVGRRLTAHLRDTSIAAINGSQHTVVSGAAGAVKSILEKLNAEGVDSYELQTAHAFHSPLMAPMLDAYEEIACKITYRPPRIPLVSTLTGRIFGANETPDAAYWRRHTQQPVQFAGAVETLLAEGFDLFLEIGPKAMLQKLGRECDRQGKGLWLASLEKGREDWHVMLSSLSRLWLRGVEVKWGELDRDYPRRHVSLPTYPFARQRYWIDSAGKHDHASTHDVEERVLRSTDRAPLASTRKERIESVLRRLIATSLEINSTAVETAKPLLEMGADSIVLMSILRSIQNIFGVKLSVRQLFEQLSTIDSLTVYLEQNLSADVFPDEPPQPADDSAPQQRPLEAPAAGQLPAVNSQQELSPPEEQLLPGTSIERIMNAQLRTVSEVIAQQMEVLKQYGATAAKPLSMDVAQREPLRHAETREREGRHSSDEGAPGSPSNIYETGRRGERQTSFASPFTSFHPENVESSEPLNPCQQRHVEELITRYVRRTATSKKLAQTHKTAHADFRNSMNFHLDTKEMLYPLVVERSDGSKLWDADGNEYVDLTMGFGVNLFGHNPPFVVEAVREQLTQGIQLGPLTNVANEVAELIRELTKVERVTFSNTGTEAVMAALRLARAVTGRRKVVLFDGSYHGTFDGVLATPQVIDGRASVLPASPGVPDGMVQDVLVLNYGSAQALDYIRRHAHELAAVLVEPVQSRRPDFQPAEFLRELRRATEAGGAALIFDEVITGFRIHPGGAQAWFGVSADIVTYGKVVGGGMPIGIIAGKSKFIDAIDGGSWNYGDSSYPRTKSALYAGTFCKHPLAMAAARAVLEHLRRTGAALQQGLNERTNSLAAALNSLFEERGLSLRVEHFGSLFRFVFPLELAASVEADLFFYHLLAKGIYIWEGRNCFLSTSHTDEDLAFIVRSVEETLEAMRAGGFLLSKSSPNLSHTEKRVREEAASATYPLTEAQEQLWVLAQLGHAGYEPVTLELRGTLDATALRRALQKVVARHEALRTVFSPDGNSQRVLPEIEVELPVVDFSAPGLAGRETKVADWLHANSGQPLDLMRGPLFRAHILRLEEQRHLLVWVSHHIVVDGWSTIVLLQEMARFYTAECAGTAFHPPRPMRFEEYATLLSARLQSEEMLADEDYWLEKLSRQIPPLELPQDRPRPQVKSYRGARHTVKLDAALLDELKELATRQRSTLFMVLLAGYSVWLHRLCRQSEILVGFLVSGRSSFEGSESLVGYCSHPVPVRSVVERPLTFVEYVDYLRGELLESYEHQNYPYARLINRLNPRREANRPPILNATFNLEPPLTLPPMPGLETGLAPSVISYTGFDIHLNVTELKDGLLVHLDYNRDVLDAPAASRMLTQYQTLLQAALSNPTHAIQTLPLLGESERRRILFDWNNRETTPPTQLCVHQLFERQAGRTPDATAVVFDEQTLTYAQLNQRADELAGYLRSLGVSPDVRVGICVRHSLELMVGLLGILKAGGAYLPLDAEHPPERLRFMLEDAGVQIVLTEERQRKAVSAHVRHTVCLDTDWETIEATRRTEPAAVPSLEHLAYVIYTSGSTGKPKGVMVTHGSLGNYLNWCVTAYGADGGTGAPVHSPVSFDLTVTSLFAPLLAGQSILMLPEERGGENLSIALRRQPDFSFVKLTPAHLEILGRQLKDAEVAGSVRTLILGGEALQYETISFWRGKAPETRIINEYGPTETVVGCCTYEVRDELKQGSGVPIGTPIANTQLYILDEYLQPVPVGVKGELYIGGDGLARGYMNRPDLTAERFIPHPFSRQGGARLYKTGDAACYRADGIIEYWGRTDQQLKIRGFRIEPGEIESVLREHRAIREAVVTACEDGARAVRLVAYLSKAEAAPTFTELKSYLRERLPEYMIPSAFVFLDEMPLTPNGKINRPALPPPAFDRPEPDDDTVRPRTAVEETLSEIWSDGLSLAKIGIQDNFFQLGGHSLLATQVMLRVREKFNLALPVHLIFESPTIAALAERIEAINWANTEVNVALEETRGMREVGEL